MPTLNQEKKTATMIALLALIFITYTFSALILKPRISDFKSTDWVYLIAGAQDYAQGEGRFTFTLHDVIAAGYSPINNAELLQRRALCDNPKAMLFSVAGERVTVTLDPEFCSKEFDLLPLYSPF
jgi:hypothetical protein